MGDGPWHDGHYAVNLSANHGVERVILIVGESDAPYNDVSVMMLRVSARVSVRTSEVVDGSFHDVSVRVSVNAMVMFFVQAEPVWV